MKKFSQLLCHSHLGHFPEEQKQWIHKRNKEYYIETENCLLYGNYVSQSNVAKQNLINTCLKFWNQNGNKNILGW